MIGEGARGQLAKVAFRQSPWHFVSVRACIGVSPLGDLGFSTPSGAGGSSQPQTTKAEPTYEGAVSSLCLVSCAATPLSSSRMKDKLTQKRSPKSILYAAIKKTSMSLTCQSLQIFRLVKVDSHNRRPKRPKIGTKTVTVERATLVAARGATTDAVMR